MKIYYETPLGRLWHGDCVEGMEHIQAIDLILTDPPYGIGVGGSKPLGSVGGSNVCHVNNYIQFEDSKRPSQKCFDLMLSISRNQIIFGGNYFLDYLYPTPCFLVWDKDNTGNFADCEIAWASFKSAVRKFKWRWNGMLKEAPEKRYHLTQKPVGLFMQILRKYSQEKELILDPFLGSGTTAIACERLKRRWIGIEIEEKYCDIAAKRIEAERKQLKLF